jgi:hypothetical protein
MSTKTLCTRCFNGYWDIYGSKFIKGVKSLNTKPDEILIVSDAPIDAPSNYRVVLIEPIDEPTEGWNVGKYRQAMLDNAKCDWICAIDIDDFILPQFLDNINDDYDVINHFPKFLYDRPTFDNNYFGMSEDPQMNWDLFVDNMHSWVLNPMSIVPPHPMAPPAFIKNDFIKKNKIKLPLIGHEDVFLAFFLRLKNARVLWEKFGRYDYNLHYTSVSANFDNFTRKSLETAEYIKNNFNI